MSKIEKTLELNITHEILSLADSFWWFLQPISLKRYWRPHWRFPFMSTPQSFATGLHINLEGKVDGGYDVSIESPSNFQGGNPRLLFIQFKAGQEKKYSTNKKSIFHGTSKKPNIHVEFDINNNNNKDQHKLLSDIASKAGNKDAVVYAFPRIVNNNQLKQNLGRLLRKTSFISISDIDKKASDNGVTIDDGNAHKFKTCYNDYNKNEINFFFFFFGKPPKPGGLLGEIFEIRIYRALKELKKVILYDYPISKFHILDAFIRHILNIGKHFSIPLRQIRQNLSKYPEIRRRLLYYEEYEDMPVTDESEYETTEYTNDIFQGILNGVSKYLNWVNELSDFRTAKIPEPSLEYTIEMTSEGIRFSLDGILEIQDEIEDSIGDITYSLL